MWSWKKEIRIGINININLDSDSVFWMTTCLPLCGEVKTVATSTQGKHSVINRDHANTPPPTLSQTKFCQ